jgi:hypothetical protein
MFVYVCVCVCVCVCLCVRVCVCAIMWGKRDEELVVLHHVALFVVLLLCWSE